MRAFRIAKLTINVLKLERENEIEDGELENNEKEPNEKSTGCIGEICRISHNYVL
jgi:hypothetical protein